MSLSSWQSTNLTTSNQSHQHRQWPLVSQLVCCISEHPHANGRWERVPCLESWGRNFSKDATTRVVSKSSPWTQELGQETPLTPCDFEAISAGLFGQDRRVGEVLDSLLRASHAQFLGFKRRNGRFGSRCQDTKGMTSMSSCVQQLHANARWHCSLLKHVRSASKLGTFLQIALDWTQLHAGVFFSIFANTSVSLPHLETGWFPAIRKFLGSIGASIHFHQKQEPGSSLCEQRSFCSTGMQN